MLCKKRAKKKQQQNKQTKLTHLLYKHLHKGYIKAAENYPSTKSDGNATNNYGCGSFDWKITSKQIKKRESGCNRTSKKDSKWHQNKRKKKTEKKQQQQNNKHTYFHSFIKQMTSVVTTMRRQSPKDEKRVWAKEQICDRHDDKCCFTSFWSALDK